MLLETAMRETFSFDTWSAYKLKQGRRNCKEKDAGWDCAHCRNSVLKVFTIKLELVDAGSYAKQLMLIVC